MADNRKPTIPNESYELARLLMVTRDAIGKVRNHELAQYNVNSTRVSLLLAIDELKDKASPIAIAQYLSRARHSISELLSRAERDGLVEKKWDLNSKSHVRVVLTRKGQYVIRKAGERRSIHAIMSVLSAEEAERLRSYLLTLRDYTLKKLKLRPTISALHVGDIDYEIYTLIMSTIEVVRKARQKELNRYDVDAARSGVLITIAELGEKATPVAIGKHLLRTRHSTSELLSRAEKDGLIEKKWDLKRKDHVRVVLTRKGKIVTKKTLRGVILPKIMYSLSREERLHLRILLFVLFNKALETIKVSLSA